MKFRLFEKMILFFMALISTNLFCSVAPTPAGYPKKNEIRRIIDDEELDKIVIKESSPARAEDQAIKLYDAHFKGTNTFKFGEVVLFPAQTAPGSTSSQNIPNTYMLGSITWKKPNGYYTVGWSIKNTGVSQEFNPRDLGKFSKLTISKSTYDTLFPKAETTSKTKVAPN